MIQNDGGCRNRAYPLRRAGQQAQDKKELISCAPNIKSLYYWDVLTAIELGYFEVISGQTPADFAVMHNAARILRYAGGPH